MTARIARIDLTGPARAGVDPRDVLPRAALDVAAAVDVVRPLCDDVRDNGTKAILDITERFDGVRLTATRVPTAVIEQALVDLDPAVRAALVEAIVARSGRPRGAATRRRHGSR